MENQFENMDLLDDDLIDFDDETTETQEFLESKTEETSEDSSKSKKPIYIATGIVAMLTIVLGATYLLNGDVSPEQEQANQNQNQDQEQQLSTGISPNNKVDPDTFDMNTYEFEQSKHPIDPATVEKEDTLIYWENPNNENEFVGFTEDGQLFGRVDDDWYENYGTEEYSEQLKLEDQQAREEYWRENPDEAPPGEWLEDGTYQLSGETIKVDVVERQEVVVTTPDGEVLLDAQGNEMTKVEDVVVGQEDLFVAESNKPGQLTPEQVQDRLNYGNQGNQYTDPNIKFG